MTELPVQVRLPWLVMTVGLFFAHSTENLVNDYIDFSRGIDEDNYYRAQYGPQPLVHGLLTKRQLLTYALVTGLLALACFAAASSPWTSRIQTAANVPYCQVIGAMGNRNSRSIQCRLIKMPA